LHELGKFLVIIGRRPSTIVGIMLWKTGALGGLGRLPGDISIHKGNSSFYFPIVTCLLISVVLTLLMWLFEDD
jgi:hypothetical protein